MNYYENHYEFFPFFVHLKMSLFLLSKTTQNIPANTE